MLNFIMGLIGTLLYPLFSIIFVLIDLLQGVFSGLAGIGDITFKSGSIMGFGGATNITAPNGGDGGETSTGLIYYLLTSDLIKNLFLSIMTLALILIIIFTAMAFIKNAYASKQKTWQEIVGNAFKGLANFIFIPVCCLLGVWLSNILLVAINGATSTGGATKMSRKLYICCAYDANHYRIAAEKNVEDEEAEALESWAKGYGVDVNVESGQDMEYYAAIVDRVYAETNISIYDQITVGQYYSLFAFNYITLIVGGVFMLYVLVNLAYAMIKRMFLLLMLFVISPAICAMYPIDEGSAVGNWKKEFIKYTIAAYGAIAGLNLFFSILPIVEGINIVSWGGAFVNEIFQLLMMVCGLFVVKEFMGTLSGWIGGDNAMATGESMRKQAKGAVAKYTTGAVKTAKGITGAFKQAKGYKDAGGSWGASMFRSAVGGMEKATGLGTGFSEVLNWGKDNREKYKAGRKDFTERDDLKHNIAAQKQFSKNKGSYSKEIHDLENEMNIAKGVNGEDSKEYADAKDAYYEKIYSVKKEGKHAGLSDTDVAQDIAGAYGGDRVKAKKELEEAEKHHDAQVKAKEQAEEDEKLQTDKQQSNEQLAKLIGEAVAGAIPATSVPGETRAEESKRDREEFVLFKSINDHLANLVKIEQVGGGSAADEGLAETIKNLMSAMAPGNGVSPGFRGQVEKIVSSGGEITTDKIVGNASTTQLNFDKVQTEIDAYNAALATKKAAEEMAKEATTAFVEEMKKAAKGNADALKVIEKFEKAADHTVDAVQKLAKELQNLLKK